MVNELQSFLNKYFFFLLMCWSKRFRCIIIIIIITTTTIIIITITTDVIFLILILLITHTVIVSISYIMTWWWWWWWWWYYYYSLEKYLWNFFLASKSHTRTKNCRHEVPVHKNVSFLMVHKKERDVTAFRPALGPIQPPMHWLPWVLSKVARVWSWPLTSI